MPNPIELLKLRNDINAKVIIFGKYDNKTVLESTKGIMVGEFAIGGSNEFQSIFELAFQQNLQNKLTTIKAVTDSLLGFFGSDLRLPDIRVKRVEQTKLTWITSALPTYTVQLLFLAIEQNDDVRKEVFNIQQATYPIISQDSKTIIPPLRYTGTPNKADQNTPSGGRLNIHLGQWFLATNQVIREVNFTFSKELVSPGDVGIPTPLYAIGTVTFSPSQMISADDLKGYFPGI